MSLGGLPGRFVWMKRKSVTTKDIIMWILTTSTSTSGSGSENVEGRDHSSDILVLARWACWDYRMDASWELLPLLLQEGRNGK